MIIREAEEKDLQATLEVNVRAFGEEGGVIVELVESLLGDPTAEPCLSLLAWEGEQAVGHILFSRISLDSAPEVKMQLLAPMAVVPERQKQGIGGKLITEGLSLLKKQGVQVVFVLGWPDYYPRYGFKPVIPHIWEPPYSIEEKNHNAWMVQRIKAGAEPPPGRIRCADTLRKEMYWRE